MLLLLLMYASPFAAMMMYWRAQGARVRDAAGGPVEAGPGSPRLALASTLDAHRELLRPAGAALAAAVALAWAASGLAGGLALLAGALLALAANSLAESSLRSAVPGEDARSPSSRWHRASAAVLGVSALVVGAVGAMAWFFADPAGASVLACFLYGASSASLLLAMSARKDAAASPQLVTGPVQALLAAVSAALMTASAVEPDGLLPLGGLLAESETLRSELLLMPIALVLLSPLVAALAGPLASLLVEREGDAGTFTAELAVAALLVVLVALVVVACGLAWTVAGAFAAGVAARQLAVVADRSALRAGSQAGPSRPAIAPAFLAVAALATGGWLAGPCGISLAAIGVAATFAPASAGRLARQASPASAARAGGDSTADSAAQVAATLAVLASASPVIAAETLHHGGALTLVVTSPPSLLLAAVLGAAVAARGSAAFAAPRGDGEASRFAAMATASAALLPAVAGMMLGAGAAVGVALGFAAWVSASTPPGEAGEDPAAAGLPRPVALAWARTMALSAVVGASLVC